MSKIPVIFRADKRGELKGDMTAVFPTLESNYGHCVCYAHIGQHSECSAEWYWDETRAAKPDEYAGLLAELRRIYDCDGDSLAVRQRMPRGVWSKRV